MGQIICGCESCTARMNNLSHTKTDLLQGENKMRVPQVGDYVLFNFLGLKTVRKVLSIDPSGEMFQTSDHDGWFMDNRYSSWEFADHEPENRDLPQVGDYVRLTQRTGRPILRVESISESGNLFRTEGNEEWFMDNSYHSWEFAERPIQTTEAASKHDEEKPPMDLLDRTWMEETAKVLAFGSRKYSPNNWRRGLAQSRLIAAALRHITAYNDGEDADPESGLSHIAHASCCLMFLQNGIKEHPELDDRHKK